MLGTLLLVTWIIRDMPEASPHNAGVEGTSQRGEGARIRARIQRIVDTKEQADAVAAADLLLAELYDRRSSDEDSLPAELREELAHEVIGLRTRLQLDVSTLAPGFRRDFVASVAPGAAWSDWKLGVPASITVAQAILESSWGRVAPGFNLFGVKGVGPAGSNRSNVVEYQRNKRKVKKANFRAYSSYEGSLEDHARILSTSRHYARARAVAEDIPAYAKALQGTYATDPRYAQKLVAMVERYDLARFDWTARTPWR